MRVLKFLAIAAAAASLAGCLGGGGGTAAAPELRGTAAIGAPLAGATVTLRGTNGVEIETRANPQGAFVFSDISRLTAPAMLRAEGNAGGTSHTLFSVASTLPTAGGSAVANVTPLTHAVTQQVMGSDLAAAFAGFDSPADLDVASLNTAIERVLRVLDLAIVAVGVPGANPFTTSFSADQTGLDKLLDLIEFRYDTGVLTVTDRGTQASVAVQTTGPAPTTPLTASPALAWDLTGIKPFIERFNAAALDDNARRAMFHTDFHHEGQHIDSAILGLRGSRVEQVAINGCKSVGIVETCTIRGLLVNPATIDNPFIIDLRRDVNEWRIFGNQSQTVTRPTVTAPTTPVVRTTPPELNWELPTAPTNAILQSNLNGNMAFRMTMFNGFTYTVQASVGSTLFHSLMRTAPLPYGLGSLAIETNRLIHGLNSDLVQTSARSSIDSFSLLADGAGNAAVACFPQLRTTDNWNRTVVLLSHNLRQVTLEHALANGLANQPFDVVDCASASINRATTGIWHSNWVRLRADGTLDLFNSANATTPEHSMGIDDVRGLLSDAGFSYTDGGLRFVDRARIYELVVTIAGRQERMFFILQQSSTDDHPERDSVSLLIQR